ncbi:cytochrome P450 [Obba rivulosa]|uniref:Cytochrome P450 n=1 Tax=Obba rivulosa TaxID=1052685 RepID=A0A8E2AZL4_9APHY|nr:cytochrome P450 [Obba rivulosa]
MSLLLSVSLIVPCYFLVTFLQLLIRNVRSPLRDLRGPPSRSFFMGNLRDMHDQENTNLVARWEAQYGKTFAYRGFVGGCRLLTSDRVAVAHIMGHAYEYPKPDFITDTLANMAAGTEGLLTVDGRVHRKQRKILTPAFSSSNVKHLTPIFWAKAVELRDIWMSFLRPNAAHETSAPSSSKSARYSTGKSQALPSTPSSTISTSIQPNLSSTVSSGSHARLRIPDTIPKSGKEDVFSPDTPVTSSSSPTLTVDVLRWFARATLDIIGEAGFGYQFSSLAAAARSDQGEGTQAENELARAFAVIFDAAHQFHIMTILRIWFPILRVLGRRKGKTEKEARETMRRIGLSLIEERMAAVAAETDAGSNPSGEARSSPPHDSSARLGAAVAGRDLLSVLLRSNLSSNPDQRLSRNEILCQVSSFIAAGHETTASALTWMLYALARAPDVQATLRKHLRSVDASPDAPPSPATLEKVARLPYLECAVRESLRLYAPVCSTMRVATQDDVIPVSAPYLDRHGRLRDSIQIRRGDLITIPFQTMNRSADVWGADAREFRPERWMAHGDGAQKLPGLWSNLMTFGNGNAISGHRACIGYKFALTEIKIFLFILLRDIEFSIDPSIEIEKRINIVTRPLVKSESDKGNQMPLRIRYIPPQSS